MIQMLKQNFKLIKKYFWSIIIFLLTINFIAVLTTVIVYNEEIIAREKSINKLIEKSTKITELAICEVIECKYILDTRTEKFYIYNETDNELLYYDNELPLTKIINIFDNFSITTDGDIVLYISKLNKTFILDRSQFITEIISTFEILTPALLMIFLIPIFIIIKRENEEAIMAAAGNEAMLANQSMIMITENIHHELNTPLEVIENKIEKIYRVIHSFLLIEMDNFNHHPDSYSEERRKKLLKLANLDDDFDFIRTSSDQIYSILEKMKGFKHIRYSNGNKTIKDIVESAFKIISISNSNFEFYIDEKLSHYSLNSEVVKNADLLSICINHIKNSLEANATKVLFLLSSYKSGFLYIRIIDNGNGIPKQALKKIFEPNFSTKDSSKSIRGNGMYLNKQILGSIGGHIRVVDTSKFGTTLELSFPAIKLSSKKQTKERGIDLSKFKEGLYNDRE